MHDVSTEISHSSSLGLPRGLVILGFAALSWALVIGLWQASAMMFAFIAG